MFVHYPETSLEITKQNKQNFTQTSVSDKNSILQKKENSKSEIQYLLKLKKKLANQEIETDNQSVKKIISIFKKQFSRGNASCKIYIACLNMICMLINKQKGQIKTNSIKSMITSSFIGCFLELNIKQMINLNNNIQSSLCYILQLIYESNYFQKSTSQNCLQKYKKFCCEFLLSISNNPKVLFNTLKIIDWLQTKSFLATEDYSRYQIIQCIIQRIKNFESDNLMMYQLAFKILVNADCIQDTYQLYCQIYHSGKIQGGEAFFSTLMLCYQKISDKMMNKIVKQHIFTINLVSSSLFDFLRLGISRMDFHYFFNLIEANLIETSINKWKAAVRSNCMHNFIQFVNEIKSKANHTILSHAVDDIFKVMFPEIISFFNRIRGQEPIQIE